MIIIRKLNTLFLVLIISGIYVIGVGIWNQLVNPPKTGEEIAREQIVTWAKSIVSYENRFEVEKTEFENLSDILNRRDLNESEMNRLQTCQQNILAITKDSRNLKVPSYVSKTHLLIIDSYAKSYDVIYNFNQGVKYSKSYYFNDAVIASKESEEMRIIANDQFHKLMKEFSISCTEINFCK